MSGIWGNNIQLSIFGESHGQGVGITINGIPAGVKLKFSSIYNELARRAPGISELTTSRKETDEPKFLSGILDDMTTGAPITVFFENKDVRSNDYKENEVYMRPGHADYTGYMKHFGFNDIRGGGHFSGRLTAGIVFAGAICKQLLAEDKISIGSHVKSIHNIHSNNFKESDLDLNHFKELAKKSLPVLDDSLEKLMHETILKAKSVGDSVGGVVECAIIGLPSGVGNPFFNSVESILSHLLFSIPAIKGVEFGSGFEIASMHASVANDEMRYLGYDVKTTTNHNGGIVGGITNGMPLIFRCAVKPTPSIAKTQDTVNVENRTNTEIKINGRHDPCIVLRIIPVIEAVAAIGIYDLMLERKKELNS